MIIAEDASAIQGDEGRNGEERTDDVGDGAREADRGANHDRTHDDPFQMRYQILLFISEVSAKYALSWQRLQYHDAACVPNSSVFANDHGRVLRRRNDDRHGVGAGCVVRIRELHAIAAAAQAQSVMLNIN